MVAALFLAFAIYGVVLPALTPLFPSAEVARALRNVVCVGPKAAAAGFHEPSLVFMTGTSTLLTDGSGAADFLAQGSCRFALIEQRAERSFAQRAEAIGFVTTWRHASRATISRRGGRFRSPSSVPKARSKMSIQSRTDEAAGYRPRLFDDRLDMGDATGRVRRRRRIALRPPQRLTRNTMITAVVAGLLIVTLMVWFDAWEIALMPPRGAPGLWPFRILTSFGKDSYVLLLAAVLLLAVGLAAPAMHEPARRQLLASVCVCNSCCWQYRCRLRRASC